MTRIKAQSPDEATGKTKELFNAVNSKFGVVPNMVRTMGNGNASAVLEAYLNFSGALSGGVLSAKTGKLIALAVSESNACNYCLSIHTYLALNLMKLDLATIEAARIGNSNDAKTDAILKFSKIMVAKKGLASDADVNTLKSAGVSEIELGEIIGNVALNIFTNYFNNTAQTEIDFPLVETLETAVI